MPDYDAGDVRGPCPGLNTLANHGYLPRNGVATVCSPSNFLLALLTYLVDPAVRGGSQQSLGNGYRYRYRPCNVRHDLWRQHCLVEPQS